MMLADKRNVDTNCCEDGGGNGDRQIDNRLDHRITLSQEKKCWRLLECGWVCCGDL